MHAEVVIEVASAGEFATVARGWLAGTMAEVFPELHEGLRTRPVVRSQPRPKADLDLPWGQPGHVLGTLTTYRKHPAFGGREALYSDRAWQRMLDGLDSYPLAVRVAVNDLDFRGFPVHQGQSGVTVARDAYSPDWVSLTFSAMAEDTGWPGSAETQARWAEFVKATAARAGAVAGSMTDDIGPGQSAPQRATFNLAAGIADTRDALRGYSWITIVASGIAAQLGGAQALQASGAFHEVSILPNGSLWLRATPSIDEFSGDKVRRVFEVLAPVLPEGMAKFEFSESFRIVEGVDAADYRGSGR
jgi:hypothetical protein